MPNTPPNITVNQRGAYRWSSLTGYVTTTFDHIVSVLGPPMRGSDKTTAEWFIEDANGLFATIYDWREDSTPKELYEWHVGGQSALSTALVRDVLGLV